MSKQIVVLADLADEINYHHAAAQEHAQKAIDRAFKCGKALIQAKAQVKHGEWLDWLKLNTVISERTARKYMKVSDNEAQLKNGTGADLTLNGAMRALAKPRHRIYEISTEVQRDRLDMMVATRMLAPADVKDNDLLDFYADCADLGARYQSWLMATAYYREATGKTGNLMYESGETWDNKSKQHEMVDSRAHAIKEERDEWYEAAIAKYVKYGMYSPNKMTAAGIFLMLGEMMIVRVFHCNDGWIQMDSGAD